MEYKELATEENPDELDTVQLVFLKKNRNGITPNTIFPRKHPHPPCYKYIHISAFPLYFLLLYLYCQFASCIGNHLYITFIIFLYMHYLKILHKKSFHYFNMLIGILRKLKRKLGCSAVRLSVLCYRKYKLRRKSPIITKSSKPLNFYCLIF